MNFDSVLPLLKGDVEFATQCRQAFLDGQVALDNFLWNETAQHYNAYSTVGFDYEKFVNATHLDVCGISDAGTDSKTDVQKLILINNFFPNCLVNIQHMSIVGLSLHE